MGEDLVSVIIPTFKRAKFLSRAIESVLNQTYSPIEVIVVDDNDSDSQYRRNTEEIMSYYVEKQSVKYIKHFTNQNGSAARNTGIKVAMGKYITFLDDDDAYEDTKIEKQVRVIRKLNSEFGAVYTGYNTIRGDRVVTTHTPVKSGKLTSELLQMNWGTGSGSNVLFKREIFNKIGLFDASLTRHQDWDILLRMFRYYSIYAIEECLLNVYKDSRINIPDPDKFVEVKDYYLSKFKNDINKLTLEELNNTYKIHSLELSTAYLKKKNYKKAIHFYKKAKSYAKIGKKQKISLFLILIFFNLPKKEAILINFGSAIERIRMIKN